MKKYLFNGLEAVWVGLFLLGVMPVGVMNFLGIALSIIIVLCGILSCVLIPMVYYTLYNSVERGNRWKITKKDVSPDDWQKFKNARYSEIVDFNYLWTLPVRAAFIAVLFYAGWTVWPVLVTISTLAAISSVVAFKGKLKALINEILEEIDFGTE